MHVFQELYKDVFNILRTRLPAYLTYHTPEHTAHVIEKAELISHEENVNGRDLYLIKVAALFHDIGFIRQAKNHEEIGCEICSLKLVRYNFSTEEIQRVCGMIMATKIPQQPTNLFEKIVADADLEYLGTDQFYPISQNLFNEFRHYDPHLTAGRFNELQINFMRKHHYHTDYCIANREEMKQKHLMELLQVKNEK
jgi:uncharacterized protein